MFQFNFLVLIAFDLMSHDLLSYDMSSLNLSGLNSLSVDSPSVDLTCVEVNFLFGALSDLIWFDLIGLCLTSRMILKEFFPSG